MTTWIKNENSNNGLRTHRCPHYEEEKYVDGSVMQIFCENPEVWEKYERTGDFVCPYGKEYDCDIPIHAKNLEGSKK